MIKVVDNTTAPAAVEKGKPGETVSEAKEMIILLRETISVLEKTIVVENNTQQLLREMLEVGQ